MRTFEVILKQKIRSIIHILLWNNLSTKLTVGMTNYLVSH